MSFGLTDHDFGEEHSLILHGNGKKRWRTIKIVNVSKGIEAQSVGLIGQRNQAL